MDPFGEDEVAKQYMLDAINKDTRANTTQPIAEEDARTADSFLNKSGDADEEDDDFALEMPMKKMMTLRRRPINSSMFQYES